jgi:hypothetical protein
MVGSKYEKFCTQLSTHFKRYMVIMAKRDYSKGDFQIILRTDGKIDTKQENIQDWLELDEGNPGLQLDRKTLLQTYFMCSSALTVLQNLPFICFLTFLLITVAYRVGCREWYGKHAAIFVQ